MKKKNSEIYSYVMVGLVVAGVIAKIILDLKGESLTESGEKGFKFISGIGDIASQLVK